MQVQPYYRKLVKDLNRIVVMSEGEARQVPLPTRVATRHGAVLVATRERFSNYPILQDVNKAGAMMSYDEQKRLVSQHLQARWLSCENAVDTNGSTPAAGSRPENHDAFRRIIDPPSVEQLLSDIRHCCSD